MTSWVHVVIVITMVVGKSVEVSLAVDVKPIVVLASTGIVVLVTVVENVMDVEETGGALSVTLLRWM